MDRCDVLVVGGGPAGSSCARALVRAGLDVLVLDRRTFPRDKTCAGWVTPPVLQLLELDPDEYGQRHVCQPILGFRTGLIGGRAIETRYDHVVSYGIRRCEFDDFLLQRCGARLRLGEPLARIERTSDGWLVNGTIESRLLIGAGGHFCPVARHVAPARDETGIVVRAQEVEYEATAADLARGTVDGQLPELFFCDDLQGYAWCFRKGPFLNIGLGRTEADRLSARVTEFVDLLRTTGRVVGDIPARFHGHAYKLYEGPPPPLVHDHLLLVGDAAGLAYPQSGEGIRPAVESGTLAAQAVLDARGDFTAASLDSYRTACLVRFGPPRSGSPIDWLPAGWLHVAAARLMASPWFTRHYVLDRWFLHADVPALETPASAAPLGA
jgi:flavin-dependent dehydrogenase